MSKSTNKTSQSKKIKNIKKRLNVKSRASRKFCQEQLACKGKNKADIKCIECGTYQCHFCQELLHKETSISSHVAEPVVSPSKDILCDHNCEDANYADVSCENCLKNYCFYCDYLVHNQGNKKEHSKQPFAKVEDNQDAEKEYFSCPSVDEMCDKQGLTPLKENKIRPSDQKMEMYPNEDIIQQAKKSTEKEINNPERSLPDIAHFTPISLDSNFENLVLKNGETDTAIIDLDQKMKISPINESVLLIDEYEKMKVSNVEEFCNRLGCSESFQVKVVSIFGNTGEGKSHTMNHAFFDGKEIFKTSPTQNSCTIGIWASYDPSNKLIAIDTEGLLGVSENNNRRTRLLLKVLAISDVIIYRTRAERLHNDLFTFLGDASRAYVQHFSTELRAASQRCNLSCALSDLGPIVVIFHETLHTDVIESTNEKTPEDALRHRFQSLNLSTEAFSAFEYVGTRTATPPTNFKQLQNSVTLHLKNSTVRSARTPGVIFSALKHLNEKFSGDIERSIPSTFPDQYFTCFAQCTSCGTRCTDSMNHTRDGIPHKALGKCKYQHQYENRIYYCRACYDRGEEVIVIPKTTSSTDGWMGLAKYAWSGYLLECSQCGIIYRNRQYWFGNKDPWETAVRTEIQHVWPGEQGSCQGSQNAAQRILDGVNYISETVSNISAKPTQMAKNWVADQIAPAYWIPNCRIMHCGICEKEFEETDQKHHCRACGGGFCENCSSKTRPVPERGWGLDPVRVCDRCYDECSDLNSDNAVTARKVGEVIQTTLGSVASAIDYPLEWIKDSARPDYWIPDKDIKDCKICSEEFNEKHPIHHCRACGHGVCDSCSQSRRSVSTRGWDHPVRICDECNKKHNL